MINAKQHKVNNNYMSNEELIALYQENRDLSIRNRIILNNIGLVYSAAKKKVKSNTSFTIEDLVQEGIIGMIKSIEKFDITKNVSFSTYAYYWIDLQFLHLFEYTGRLRIHLPWIFPMHLLIFPFLHQNV